MATHRSSLRGSRAKTAAKAVENFPGCIRCQTPATAVLDHALMRLQHAAMGAVRAQQAHERMMRMGRTPNGHQLWLPREDAIVLALYPDYRAMRKALRRRSIVALWHRARFLGIARRTHIWLTTEVSRLRRLFGTANRDDVLRAFPEMTWRQVEAKAHRLGLQRPRRKPKATGHPMVDDVRLRAHQLNYSMADLDAVARSKRYFQKDAKYRASVNGQVLFRAIEALGGEVSIRWESAR